MKRPSGDQAGSSLFTVLGVNVRSPPPSRPITPICTAPAETSENAIRDPSGDHDGYSAGDLVRRVGFEPSVAIVHRFSEPDRVEAKAMLLPSGDHDGDQSLAPCRVRFVALAPSMPITQISSSWLMPRLESR